MVLLPARARPATPKPGSASARTLLVTGASASVWAAGAGILVGTVLAIATWAVGGASGADAVAAARFGALLWLLSQHAGIEVGAGYVGLVPLGLAALPLLLCLRVLRTAMRGFAEREPSSAVLLYLSFVTGYAGLAAGAAVALGALGGAARPVWWQAGVGAAAVAALGGGLGAARFLAAPARALGVALARPVLDRATWLTPGRIVAVLGGSLAAVCTLVAGSSLLLALGLASGLDQLVDLSSALAGGQLKSGAPILVASVLLLPNAVLWAMAYALGPGFAVGVGTSVTPAAVELSTVPAVPVLAALPTGA
ncbi:MAG: DUF6350 family protein, partial [Sporichthyaceae bacterium]|nr:DUF6350 family protein [Sporichthyaceae bacterium]